jgi:hypothetical protein
MAELELTCPEGAHTPEGANKGGDFALSWGGPDGGTFRLVEKEAHGDEMIVYEGPQLGSTVTGRTEGDYTYRVGLVDNGDVTRWSEPCDVLVRPYPLSLAFVFFGFGLVVTVATVTLIVRGHRAHRRGDIG